MKFKRGDTFSYRGPFPVGLPTGAWTLRCNLLTPARDTTIELQATVVLNEADETLNDIWLFAPSEETKLWPLQKLRGDIEFTQTDAQPVPFVLSTETFEVQVVADWTV